MNRMIKRAKDKLARIGSGAKVAVTAGSSVVLTTASQAAVTYSEATGFTGSIDTVPFTSASVIVVTFLGLAVAVGAGIRALRKA